MPINQSHKLHGKFKSLGLPVALHVLHGAAHGGKVFYDEARTRVVSSFLRVIRDLTRVYSAEPSAYKLPYDVYLPQSGPRWEFNAAPTATD